MAVVLLTILGRNVRKMPGSFSGQLVLGHEGGEGQASHGII